MAEGGETTDRKEGRIPVFQELASESVMFFEENPCYPGN